MLEALLKEIYKDDEVMTSSPFFETKSKGVFLGDSLLQKESAYEVFLMNNPNAKRAPLTEPIPEEVIESIIDTLNVLDDENKDLIKEKLKKGLMEINKKSLTGRTLIRGVRLFQGIETKEDLGGSIACVYDRLDVIFFNNKIFKDLSPFDFTTSFLHESEHILDKIQMRPFVESQYGYFDKGRRSIFDEISCLGISEGFFLYRLFEAEKRTQTYQIFSEMHSFSDFCLDVLNCLKMAYLRLFYIKTKESEIDKMGKLGYQSRYLKNKIKRMLNPSYWFLSDQKKQELKIKDAQKQMAEYINFLLQPAKKKKNLLIFNTSLSFFCFSGLCVYNSLLFWGAYVLTNALGLMIYFVNRGYEESRTNWCSVYNNSAYMNAYRNAVYEKGSAKKCRVILKAFQEKYHFFLTKKALEKARTDKGHFEKVFQAKKELLRLSQPVQEDVVLLARLLSKYDEKMAGASDWWVKEFFLKAKSHAKTKSTYSLELAVLETLFSNLLKNYIFDEVIKKATDEEVLKFQSSCLKKAFLLRRADFGLNVDSLVPKVKREPVCVTKQKRIKQIRRRFRGKGRSR